MNTTIILLFALFTPFISLHNVFMLRDIQKVGIKKENKKFFKELCQCCIILVVLPILAYQFITRNINTDMPILNIELSIFWAIVCSIFFYFILYNNSPFLNTKFRKIANALFTICIIIAWLFELKSIILISNSIDNFKVDVTKEIENFAHKNDMLTFNCDNFTFLNDKYSYEYVCFCDNKNYYFNIHTKDTNKEAILVDKINTENSYVFTLKNFNFSSKNICEKFDIKDSIYTGQNVHDICYLINKDNVYKICAIIDNHGNITDDNFYVEKFVLLDLKTGSISEFK